MEPRDHYLASRPHYESMTDDMEKVTVPLCHIHPKQGHQRAELQPPVVTRDVCTKSARDLSSRLREPAGQDARAGLFLFPATSRGTGPRSVQRSISSPCLITPDFPPEGLVLVSQGSALQQHHRRPKCNPETIFSLGTGRAATICYSGSRPERSITVITVITDLPNNLLYTLP
jgi:hypothetical protein